MAVYWLTAREIACVKVGYASDRRGVSFRIKKLQTGSFHRLVLLRQEDGDRGLEAAFHRHYKKQLVIDEWYDLAQSDVDIDLNDVLRFDAKIKGPILHSNPPIQREAMDVIRAQRGLMSRIASELRLTRAAVNIWQEVPVRHAQEVERITGISRHRLRPDIWQQPSTAGQAA